MSAAGTGTIISGVGGFYEVRSADGTQHTCRAGGRLRKEGVTPCVGDEVRFLPGGVDTLGFIQQVLPRRNSLKRPPVSNIDLLVVQTCPREPQPDLMLADKMLLYAQMQAIPAMLVLNKADLARPGEAQALLAQYRGADVPLLAVSAHTGEGLGALRAELRGHVCCFAGQSGVGKSSLINALFPGLDLQTGDLSAKLGRGRHTTRDVRLLQLDGCMLLDTPGFSLLEIEELEPHRLQNHYPDIAALAPGCRFSPCLHLHEPDCAVSHAAGQGLLHENRLARYRALLEDIQDKWRNRYD